MKYIIYIFFIGFFQATAVSCNKVEFDKDWESPTDKDPIERKGDTLNAFWMVRHNPGDDGKNFSIKPILYKGLIIASSNSLDGPELIFGIDTVKREMVWEWNDFLGKNYGERPWVSYSKYELNKLLKGNLILISNKGIYVLDPITGVTNHSMIFKERFFNPKSGSVQYNTMVLGLDWGGTEGRIMICDAGLNCYTAYSEEVPLNHDIYFSHPKLEVEATTGDSLIYFGVGTQDKALSFQHRKVKFVAYNLTMKKVEWTFKVPSDLGAKILALNIVNAPLIVDNMVYFQMQTHLFCLDIITGEEIWRHNYAHGVGVGQSIKLIHEKGRLYFADSRGDVTCLDAHTGRRLWFNSNSNETGGAVDDIVLYNNRLYMTDLVSLTVVDALSGKGIGKFKSPNAKRFSDAQINAITIDEENEVMYVDDGYYIMACEIPGQ